MLRILVLKTLVSYLVSYIVVILIAMQSVLAIADTDTAHQTTHQNIHQATDHHSLAELNVLNLDDMQHHDSHGECHQNHCHHSSMVYIELNSLLLFDSLNYQEIAGHNPLFISYSAMPNVRPPII